MSKKIPCGGFELGKSLAVDKDGKLDLAPGAGGVQSDWNVNDENDPAYVKNRTHYEEVTVLSNRGISDSGAPSPLMTAYTYVVGNIYMVLFDGVEYECTFKNLTNGNDYSLWGLGCYPPSDEIPFALVRGYPRSDNVTDGDVLNDISLQIYPYDFSGTIQIVENAVHQLDQKYIPSQRFDVTISQDDDGNLVSDKTPSEILEAYNNGKIVNGNTSFGFTPSFVGGNSEMVVFSVLNPDGEIMFYMVNNDKTVDNVFSPLLQPADSLSNGLILTTSNGNWIPSNSLILPSTNFVLPSSTSGSTKKFLITVDDSGTISATEYTT